jgi:hypothetical protein
MARCRCVPRNRSISRGASEGGRGALERARCLQAALQRAAATRWKGSSMPAASRSCWRRRHRWRLAGGQTLLVDKFLARRDSFVRSGKGTEPPTLVLIHVMKIASVDRTN